MTGLAIPMGGHAVREFRFGRPAKHMDVKIQPLETVYDEERRHTESLLSMRQHGERVPPHRVKALSEWFGRVGLDWDYLWTSHYGPDGQAIQDMFREIKKPVVFEIDDWFESVPRGNAAFRHWWGVKRQWMSSCLKSADRVVASTQMLADRYGGVVAPNFIDPAEWQWGPRQSKREDECVILCNGGMGRDYDYLEKRKALEAVLELPNVKLVYMNSFPDWAVRYPAGKVIWIRYVPYELYNHMVQWIAPDIIVSPLEHNDFNLAKSNLKWLEAGACGAAFVGERWGEYARTVRDGETGVLASGEAEWNEALTGLALDAERRQYVAEAGRAEVLKNWTWDAVAPQWRKAVLGEE